MILKSVLIMLFACAILYVEGSKILGVFPLPIRSHHILGAALMKELASRGHEVTMLSPYPLKKPPKNYVDVELKGLIEWKENFVLMDPNKTASVNFWNLLMQTREMPTVVLENKCLWDFLNKKPKFDAVILDWLIMESTVGISHSVKGIPIAFSCQGSTMMLSSIAAAPVPPAYIPAGVVPMTDMNFKERLINTLAYVFINTFMNAFHMSHHRSLLKKHFPSAPPLDELMNDVDLVLVNSHPATESARPYQPNMIQIGGFHLQEKETLPEDLQKFMDSSTHGVIFFSLGSNIDGTILNDKLADILEAFAQVKYDILWKHPEELSNKPKNVKFGKWLPQRAILEHPKTVAFITHGGLGSTVEAIYSGVPMICIPLFGDQMINAADTVSKGFGIKLDVYTIKANDLKEAIMEITKNPIYRNKMKVRSDLFRNQEMNPMDKAIFWIEHVIKHKGAKHLKSVAVSMPWWKYMLVDVIAFILLALFIIFSILYYSFKFVFKICCGKNKVKVQ